MNLFNGLVNLLMKFSPVKSLHKNIKGNSPGSTAVKKRDSPLKTLCEYLTGLTKIKIITIIISRERQKELIEKCFNFVALLGLIVVLLT